MAEEGRERKQSGSPPHGLVVVGASAGGVEALTRLVADLPKDLPAAVLVVLHVSASGTSVLPEILARRSALPVSHVTGEEALEAGRIYVAPPDFHLLVADGRVRATRGPRENGHRPAIDPLFRTAAQAYGPRVLAVVLSGARGDGAGGARKVKARGGTTIVQDPKEALFPDMPLKTIASDDPDHVVPVAEMGELIAEKVEGLEEDLMRREPVQEEGVVTDFAEMPGRPSGFTCPGCGGGLWEVEEAGQTRFRCHVGHSYSFDSMVAEQGDQLEHALWAALAALEQRAELLGRLADRTLAKGNTRSAAQFEAQREEIRRQAELVRRVFSETPLGSADADLAVTPHAEVGARGR